MEYDLAAALGDVQTASGFESLMAGIWEGEQEAGPNGGLVMFADARYDEFHDANKVARLVKLREGARFTHDDVPGCVWTCLDGTAIWIASDGGQCAVMG